MFFSALLSALNGAVAKLLGDELSALEIVFFRNLFGVVFILITLRHTPTQLPGGKPLLLLWRGIFGFSALLLFFYTITRIPLGEAITLNKTSPLFVALLAFFILHERLSRRGMVALIVGFLGVILITKPGGADVGLPHLLGVAGGLFAASAYTTIRSIRDIYDSRMIVLSFMATGVLIPLLLFAIAPHYAPGSLDFLLAPFIMPHTLHTWLLLTLIGITATLSQWLLTKAYSATNAGVIGIVGYSVIPFSIFFGTLLGDALPDLCTLAGIVLIVVSGLMVRRA